MASQNDDRKRPNPQQGGSGQQDRQQTQNPGQHDPQHQQGDRKQSDRKESERKSSDQQR